MKNTDWIAPFGEVPSGFEQRVLQTVSRLSRQDDKKKAGRTRPRLALVSAALALLVAGTGLALDSLGVLDTLGRHLAAFLRPEAQQLVQQQVAQEVNNPAFATFQVEEAINDGHQAFLTVRVQGEGGTLLMDDAQDPSSPMTHLHRQGQEEAPTFAEAAQGQGKQLIAVGVMPVDAKGNYLMNTAPAAFYDGGDLVFNLTYPLDSFQAQLELNTLDVFASREGAIKVSRGSIALSLPVTEARRFYDAQAQTNPAFPWGEVALSDIRIEQTPIATYLSLSYQAADKNNDIARLNVKDGLALEWLDENGQPHPRGLSAPLSSPAGETRTASLAIRAFETLPEKITIRLSSPYSGSAQATLLVNPIPAKEVSK